MSGLPFFFVRGAPPGNNGYFIDGIRIPLLYHVGAGPSVIHPGLVERVDFYPGGYPARYGRFAGGILSGETKRPAEELHGEGNIRLFDAGALLETRLRRRQARRPPNGVLPREQVRKAAERRPPMTIGLGSLRITGM